MKSRGSDHDETPFALLMRQREQQGHPLAFEKSPSPTEHPPPSQRPQRRQSSLSSSLPATAEAPPFLPSIARTHQSTRHAPLPPRVAARPPSEGRSLDGTAAAPATREPRHGLHPSGDVVEGEANPRDGRVAAAAVRGPQASSSTQSVTRSDAAGAAAKTLSLATPPRELLAAVRDLQAELAVRTDGVNAIQRNFERLGAMYRQDAQELASVRAELAALRAAEGMDRRSSEHVTGVVQAELQRSMEEVKGLQERVERGKAEREKLLARCKEADGILKALQHEKQQLVSESATLASRLSDVEELLADTQRELADANASCAERRRACVALIEFAIRSVLSMLPLGVGDREEEEEDEESAVAALRLDRERLLAALDGTEDDRECLSELLDRHVRTRIDALREAHQRDRVAWLQESEVDLCGRLLQALQEDESNARQHMANAAADAFALMLSFREAAEVADGGYQRRAAETEQARVAAGRAERQAAQSALQEGGAALQREFEHRIAGLREEAERARASAAQAQATAVEAAIEGEREKARVLVATLEASHRHELERLNADHTQAMEALRVEQAERRALHEGEMGELQRVIAQYTAQLEQQERLFASLQRRYSSDLSEQERALEEQLNAAVASAVAAAQAEWQAHAASLRQLMDAEFDGRLSRSAEEARERLRMVAASGAAASRLLASRAVATAETALRDAQTDASTLKDALVSSLASLWHAESASRAGHMHEEQVQRLSWLTPRLHAQAMAAAAVRQANATHQSDLEALRAAADNRERHTAEKLRELREQVRHAEAERDEAVSTAEALRGDLLASRDALATREAAQEGQMAAVLGAMQRVLAAEAASESAYSCPQCFQLFEKPCACVPCGHTFCEKCLLQHPRNTASLAGQPPQYCPECDLPGVTAVVEPKPLVLLGGKFLYRRQVLEEIVRSCKVAK